MYQLSKVQLTQANIFDKFHVTFFSTVNREFAGNLSRQMLFDKTSNAKFTRKICSSKGRILMGSHDDISSFFLHYILMRFFEECNGLHIPHSLHTECRKAKNTLKPLTELQITHAEVNITRRLIR